MPSYLPDGVTEEQWSELLAGRLSLAKCFSILTTFAKDVYQLQLQKEDLHEKYYSEDNDPEVVWKQVDKINKTTYDAENEFECGYSQFYEYYVDSPLTEDDVKCEARTILRTAHKKSMSLDDFVTFFQELLTKIHELDDTYADDLIVDFSDDSSRESEGLDDASAEETSFDDSSIDTHQSFARLSIETLPELDNPDNFDDSLDHLADLAVLVNKQVLLLALYCDAEIELKDDPSIRAGIETDIEKIKANYNYYLTKYLKCYSYFCRTYLNQTSTDELVLRSQAFDDLNGHSPQSMISFVDYFSHCMIARHEALVLTKTAVVKESYQSRFFAPSDCEEIVPSKKAKIEIEPEAGIKFSG